MGVVAIPYTHQRCEHQSSQQRADGQTQVADNKATRVQQSEWITRLVTCCNTAHTRASYEMLSNAADSSIRRKTLIVGLPQLCIMAGMQANRDTKAQQCQTPTSRSHLRSRASTHTAQVHCSHAAPAHSAQNATLMQPYKSPTVRDSYRVLCRSVRVAWLRVRVLYVLT